MKRVLVVILVVGLLFVLSSCYSSSYVDKLKDEWYEREVMYEAKIEELQGKIEDYESALHDISWTFPIAYCYYEKLDDDISEREAYDALESISKTLNDLGY